MTIQKQLSIIIPAYNIEAYISKCLNSLCHQGLATSEYEIIVVDDGSSDATAAEAKKSACDNLTIISQANSRQGGARNTGLKAANGKYVMYVDGDDWLFPNVLPKILHRLNETGADVLLYNIVDSSLESDPPVHQCAFDPNKIYSGKEFLAMRKFGSNPVYVYSRKFLLDNSLFFDPGVFFEDARLMPRIYFYASKIAYLDENVYVRYVRPSSSYFTFSADRASELLDASKSIFKFAEENAGDLAYRDLMFSSARVFNSFLLRALSLPRFERRKIRMPKGTFKRAMKSLISAGRLKYIVEAPLLTLAWPFLFGGCNRS